MFGVNHPEKLIKSTPGPTSNINSGSFGEKLALEVLKGNGFRIIERNFRSRLGEIDIVAEKDKALYFVEVKTRWSLKYGRAVEAVTPKKVAKFKKIGQFYAKLHPGFPQKLRLAVVAIEFSGDKISKRLILI